MNASLEEVLNRLSRHFDELLERQENMLRISRSQGQAVLSQDRETLEARTAALLVLIQENGAAEKERIELLKPVVTHFDLPVSRQTMSGLVQVLPEPWHSRFASYQQRLRQVLEETREQIRSNHLQLRRSMRIVGDAVGMLADVLPQSTTAYSAQGDAPGKLTPPAFLDRKG